MAKKAVKKKTPSEQPDLASLNKPWIEMRTGVIIVAFASLGMAILTAWQSIPSVGVVEGVLWGLFFGALIWIIFFGNLLLNRFLRRKRSGQ